MLNSKATLPPQQSKQIGGENMKLILEGEPKEIAALARELQERREESCEVAKSCTYNLIVEHDQIRDIIGHVASSPNCNIRQN